MESHANVMKHPLHPVLIVFPAAIFPLMLLLDVVYWFAPSGGLWAAGFWLAVAGVAMGALAAATGFFDYAHIPRDTHARKTGTTHMVLGLATVALYAVAAIVRWPGFMDINFLVATSIDVVGVIAVSVQGYLGGSLVYKHHLGVVTEAEGGHPVAWDDAPGGAGVSGRARRGHLRP